MLIILLLPPGVMAARTDIVYLHNGDRITGEVKRLERGKLEFKTDHMGTIYIEWDDILEINSKIGQSVELTNGQRFYGTLEKPEQEDMVAIKTYQGTIAFETIDVVDMYPVSADNFWDRLDLNASIGFSWDKSSNVGKYTIGLDSVYRETDARTTLDFSAELTTQEERDDTSRAVMTLSRQKYRPNKRFWQYFANAETNDELGLDLRGLVGVGYGFLPIRTPSSILSLGAGLAVNHEIPQIGDSQSGIEGVLFGHYDYYRWADPERQITTGLMVFPSLSEFGRWRAMFNTRLRIEIISDLFWDMTVYASYDSDPISPEASNSDYGITSSVGYKF